MKLIQRGEHGEDTFLYNYINWNNIDVPKFIIDIGAFDGLFFSNSAMFIADGWEAVLIEPHPESFAELVKNHPDQLTLNCAIMKQDGMMYLEPKHHPTHATVCADVTPYEVECFAFSTMYDALMLEEVGILSIDAEGNDTDILRDALECCEPTFIIIEANTQEDKWAQTDLLIEKYDIIFEAGVNTIWAKR